MNKISCKELYIPCVSCEKWCSDIIRDEDRHIPRGFYSEAQPGTPVVMFLSMNPGGGIQGPIEQKGFYKGTPKEKVEKHFQFMREILFFPPKPFQRKLQQQIIAILSMPWDEARNHVIITPLFKCTSDGDGMASTETISTCVDMHLKRELKAWNPICIFTLGDKVEEWVNKNSTIFENYEIRNLTHPSFRGMTDEKFINEAKQILGSMPEEINNKIKSIR